MIRERCKTDLMGKRRFGAFLAIVLAATTLATAAARGSTEPRSGCGTVQERVDGATAGATVDLPDGCVYRETVTIDKSLTLKGGPGVEIRGSDVWAGWAKSGNHWVRGTLPKFKTLWRTTDPQHPYPCDYGTGRCLWPAQVFFDGKPLVQVASDPSSGQFAVDGDRRVILADDPDGHEVEVTTRRRWVVGEADDVTIEGVAMKHAANAAQSSAITNGGHDGWTIRDCDLSYAHGVTLNMSHAAGLVVEGSRIHHAGQLGIGSSNADLEVRDSEIDHNNTEGFYPGWSAGGLKATGADRLVVEGSEIHHNDRTGVWADAGCENVTYSNNRVYHNPKRGLHLEITDHAEVSGNVVWENAWGEDAGAGISATASRNVDIHDNVLAWNSDGVAIVNSQREHGTGATSSKYDAVEGIHVHDNTFLSEDIPSPAGAEKEYSKLHLALIWNQADEEGNLYDPAADNRGYGNRYWYPKREGKGRYRFFYEKPIESLAAFNRTLGEEGGSYLSDAEKAQVVTDNGLPAEPER